MTVNQSVTVSVSANASGGTDTSDATAAATDIHSGKTAYGSAGTKITGTAPSYKPAMMSYDGSTNYYSETSMTHSGNAQTFVCRFKIPSFTGDTTQRLTTMIANSQFRIIVTVYSNDHTITDRRQLLQCTAYSNASAEVCSLFSNVAVTDDTIHNLLFAYDGTAGTAVMTLDGLDAIDSGHSSHLAPTTTTMATDAGAGDIYIGALNDANQKVTGQIGFVGTHDTYVTTYSSFFDSNGNPIALDESTWAEWGTQPQLWNEHGQCQNNLGTEGDFTETGVFDIGKGGN